MPHHTSCHRVLMTTILLAAIPVISAALNGEEFNHDSIRLADQVAPQEQMVTIHNDLAFQGIPAIFEQAVSSKRALAAGEHQQLGLDAPVSPSAVKFEQKCSPILDLQALIPSAPPTNQTGTKSKDAGFDKFSFSIGDIEMPVAPSEGSLSSAIKLLSSFGSQFDVPPQAEELQGEEDVGEQNLVKFKDNHLQIQGLNLTMLNVHLFAGDGEPKFGVGILIKNTSLTGRFTYNGPIQLSGFYRMAIDNVYLVASSNLTRERTLRAGEQSNVVESGVILRTNEFKMNITNLGYISIDIFDSKDSSKPTTNYLLRMLQRLLQKTIKRTYYSFENYIRETLEKESRRSLDCELARLTHLIDNSASGLATTTASTASHQNILSRILSSEIVKSHLDTIALPDFTYQQQLLGAGATIQFYNGSLAGLGNIKLNGETRIKLQDEHLFVNTSVGWSDLHPFYNWALFIGSSKTPTISNGRVMFNIRAVDFDAVLTKGLKSHTRIAVDQLIIRRLDNPKMDISGLPGMNRVTRGMVNFFMGRLKQRLASSIQPALKQQLEWSLNKMNIFL